MRPSIKLLLVPSLSLFTAACVPPPEEMIVAKCPEVAAPPLAPRREAQRMYRLDFVLASTSSDGAAEPTSFSLTLGEHDHGNVMAGKNVPLQPPSASGAPSPRQDVGIKVMTTLRDALADEEVMLDVQTEFSALESGGAIRKMVSSSKVLAAAGRPTVVASLAEDHRQYRLTVTPTRVR